LRILGIDYGLRRIGIAVGDTEVDMAFARDAIPSQPDAASAIAKLYRDEMCERAVIGHPILESGEPGEQARITEKFADSLKTLGVEVILFDERYTTSAARRNLAHMDSKDRKKYLDSEAARLMLAEYLASLDS